VALKTALPVLAVVTNFHPLPAAPEIRGKRVRCCDPIVVSRRNYFYKNPANKMGLFFKNTHGCAYFLDKKPDH
jgi:hypothetical protein